MAASIKRSQVNRIMREADEFIRSFKYILVSNNEGFFVFTVRNGKSADLARGSSMLYAEKAMISWKDQCCLMHRHHIKAEGIINRGGGALAVELCGRYRWPARPRQRRFRS